MKVEKTASGRFRISEGDFSIEVTQASYEDLFYALPLDPPTLFLLLNETVLCRKEDREVLKRIVAVYGNIQQAMPVLGREVERCDPKTAEVEIPVVAGDTGPTTETEARTALAGLVEEVVTRKPGGPPRVVPPTLPVPPARPPGKGKTRKTKKSKIRQAKSSVDDDIPVAEVVMPSPRVAAPPSGKAASPPAAGAPPAAPVVVRGDAPPASERKRHLGVMRTPDIEFWITDGDLVIRLTQKRYEELHRALPLDNTTLYRFLNDSILTTPEERERFQELVRRSGGVDEALSLLQHQVKMLPPDPTAAIPVRKPSLIETPLARPSPVAPRPPAAAPGSAAASTAGKPAVPGQPPSRTALPAVGPRPSTPGLLAPGARPPAAASQKQPPAGPRILDLEVESVTGEKYRIIYGNLMLTLGKAQYQELYYSLPSDNVSLFRLLFTKILTDPESRNTLKKMVEKAGSNKLFFDSLQIRVREVTPTQTWD